jgi:hypothetical protein
MFDKFKNITSPSQQAETVIGTQSGAESTEKGDMSTFDMLTGKVSSAISGTKNIVNDLNMMNKIQDFTKNAVKVVSELDDHLTRSNSSYEISSFRVVASVTVTGGMTLDISFLKNPMAKALSQETAKNVSVINPKTGKSFKVPRIALAGKEKAKIKDPETGEILIIDAKTGAVIPA